MKKAMLLSLVAQLAMSLFAASRVTVDQLNEVIATSRGERDSKIAGRLTGIELTERLSASNLAVMESSLPGPESRRALLLLADQATFLDPPEVDIPKDPPPNFEQQRIIIAKAIEYVKGMQERLPNLFAQRDTIHFEDSPPGLKMGSESSFNPAQPLHPVSRTPVTVLYHDGQDFVQVNGKEQPATTLVTTGLSSFGEFGPILSKVLIDLPQGKLAWSHWERGAKKRTAVFAFSVPKAASHYAIRFCCVGTQPFQQFSGYRGEMTIDPVDGTILRLTLMADFAKNDPVTQADLMVEYGPVELGGKTYFCPTKSISLSLAADQSAFRGARSFTDAIGVAHTVPAEDLSRVPKQTMLNEVAYDHYHLFQSDARILLGAIPESSSTRVTDGNSAANDVQSPASPAKDETLISSEKPAPSGSAPDAVVTSSETAPVLSKGAVPPSIAATPSTPLTPEIAFVSPSDLPLTPAVPAPPSTPAGYSLHVSTRLVEVGVTAYDKNGQPIKDLSRDVFEVSDNGKKQVLRSFGRACAEVEGPLKAAAGVQPIQYSNRFDVKISAQSERTCVAENSTVILLDATRLGIAHFTRVREEILKFLERLPASESVGLYVRNGDGFQVLAEATANHDALSSALQKWMPNNEELAPGRKEATRNLQLAEAAQTAGDMNYMNGTIGGNKNGTQNVSSVWEIPGGGEAQVDPRLRAEDIQKTRQSLIVIGAVAAHMAAIPGHKNLVWLAGDSVLADWTDQTAGSSNGPYSLSSAAMRTQEALNDARVSLYPLGASQIEATAIDATLKNSSAQAIEKSKQTAHSVDGAFQKMAEATGGRSFSKSENIVTGLINVIEDGQATYLLSFTPSTQPDDKFHWLRIDLLRRRGITLRYRVGYLYSKEPTTLKERFNQVIWQPLDATEVALSVHRTSASVGSTVSLNISAQDISLVEQGDRRTGKLDIFFVQRDQAGRRAEVKEQTLALDLRTATYERLLQDGIPFDQHFDDKQNSGIVRIIVVDENSGRIGSVTLPAAN